MFRTNAAKPIHKSVFINEHADTKNEHLHIPISSLKCLEEELIKKELLSLRSPFPLWFLAETERNIYLWKNGQSIIDKEKYDFVVDPLKLAEKRIHKLKLSVRDEENPFFDGEQELQYLEEFVRQYKLLSLHIETFLCALNDVLPTQAAPSMVALPR